VKLVAVATLSAINTSGYMVGMPFNIAFLAVKEA
jgi:hypothetical protein